MIKAILRKIRLVYKTPRYGYMGDYSSWYDAQKHSIGYEADEILKKVKKSLLLVKNGKAPAERDSVIFSRKYYPWSLLAGLNLVARLSGNRLKVLDFGGSLGSSYFHCKDLFQDVETFSWSIVEQKHFVDCGRKNFQNKSLKFYYDIDSVFLETPPDVLLLSGVVQYLEKPYEFIKEAIKHDFPFIIVERTPFSKSGKDELCVQVIPPEIYNGSYPCWLLNLNKFKVIFNNYDLVAEYKEELDDIDHRSTPMGMIFKRKEK